MKYLNRIARRKSGSGIPSLPVLTLFFAALIVLGGCAESDGMAPSRYVEHSNPAIKSQLQEVTERYFACVYRAVDNNIRFAPADDTRTILQAAVEDCRSALKTLSHDVARLNIRASIATDLVNTAERQSYAIAREGLRRYFEKAAAK